MFVFFRSSTSVYSEPHMKEHSHKIYDVYLAYVRQKQGLVTRRPIETGGQAFHIQYDLDGNRLFWWGAEGPEDPLLKPLHVAANPYIHAQCLLPY